MGNDSVGTVIEGCSLENQLSYCINSSMESTQHNEAHLAMCSDVICTMHTYEIIFQLQYLIKYLLFSVERPS